MRRDQVESTIYDYAEGAVDYETIEEAIDAFRVGDTFPLRQDWRASRG